MPADQAFGAKQESELIARIAGARELLAKCPFPDVRDTISGNIAKLQCEMLTLTGSK